MEGLGSYEEMQFKLQAAIHGIDIDKTMEKKRSTTMEKTASVAAYPELPRKEGEVDLPFKFADPSTYAHLSQEEKQALTEKMMGAHKRFLTEQQILGEGKQVKKPPL
jgi:hypothetical protein